MNMLQATNSIRQESPLLDEVSKWPDWKIQALCLDESDLQIKEAIQARRLTNMNNEENESEEK